MKRMIVAAASVSLFALAAVMAWLTDINGELTGFLFVIGIYLFNATPIIGAVFLSLTNNMDYLRPVFLLFIVGWSLYEGKVIYDNFFVEPDAQSGLIFLGLPGIGLAVLLGITAAGASLAAILKRWGVR